MVVCSHRKVRPVFLRRALFLFGPTTSSAPVLPRAFFWAAQYDAPAFGRGFFVLVAQTCLPPAGRAGRLALVHPESSKVCALPA